MKNRNQASFWKDQTVAVGVDKQQIESILAAYENTLPQDLPLEQRITLIKQRREFFELNWGLVEQCKNDKFSSLLLEEMSAAITQIATSKGEDTSRLIAVLNKFKKPIPKAQFVEAPSVAKHFLSTVAWGALSVYAPLAVAGLTIGSFLVPAAAQTAGITSHGGIPTGGQDLCSGSSYCNQGWIASPSGAILTQFNNIVQQVGSFNLGALWQMTRCMSSGLISDIVKFTLETTPGNTTTILPTCLAKSDTLYGYMGSSEITNVATDTCNAFQNNYPSMTTKCINSGDAYGLNIAVSLMCIAAIGLLVCAIGGAVVAVKKCDPDCRPCRNTCC